MFWKKKEKIQIAEGETIHDAKNNLEYLQQFKFQKNLKRLKKQLKNKTIIIYGAGAFFQVIQKYYDLTGLNIIGIADRGFYEHEENETSLGYKVYSPEEIKDLNPDCVLVATKRYMDIIEDLYFNTLKDTKIKIKPIVKKGFFDLIKEIWM